MTDAELLSKAIVFEAGPVPAVNCWIIEDDDVADSKPPMITIKKHGGRWWIHEGPFVLGIDHRWDYVANWYAWPSRFGLSWATAKEAFDYLAAWRPDFRQRAASWPNMKRWKDREKS